METCFKYNNYITSYNIRGQAWGNEFRGGEDQVLGALTEKGPKRRTHKVYVKISNCLKNSTMSVKRVHFKKCRVPLGPSQEMKFLGPGATGPPGLQGFSSPVHGFVSFIRNKNNTTTLLLLKAKKTFETLQCAVQKQHCV